MEPEEIERLTSLCFRYLSQARKVLVSLLCTAIVNVWQEGEDTDDLTGVLAFGIVYFLLDHLVDFWLNIGLVEKITHERGDALCITSSLISLFFRIGLSLAVVPVQDGGVALDLEALS